MALLKKLYTLIFASLSLLANSDILAETPAPFSPARFDKLNIRLDGRLDEKIWTTIEPVISWRRLTPNEGAPPSEKSIVRLAYDADAIYLAAQLFESNSSNIMTRSLERDSWGPEQDGVCLVLDTYNDNRTAFGFIVTPAGVRTDIAIFNDAEGSRQPWNADWDTFWDAATHRDETGWTVEVRIPFSSLRFNETSGETEMGMILWRYLARNAEYDVFPEIPNTWTYSAYKPSKALKIRFVGVAKRNPIYLKPYALNGLRRDNNLNADATAYRRNVTWKRDIGFDLKYNVTSNLIFDATVNTDFAQVEVDDQIVNTSRFSPFFPEKRDFFQERADLFTYRFPGGLQRIFQSRTIGIHETGEPVPILGGVRLTGRAGAWEIGLIEMQTGETQIVQTDTVEVPSHNFGVFRLRRQAFERGSYIGAMVTSKTDFDGNNNGVFAADADIRIWGPQYVKIQIGQGAETGGDLSRGRFAAIVVQRRLRKGFAFGAAASHLGPDLNPGVGFVNRPGVNWTGNRFQYTWFPKGGLLQNHTLTNRTNFFWNVDSKVFETFDDRLSWDALLKSGARLHMSALYKREVIANTFSVGNVEVLPGKYKFSSGSFRYSSASASALRYQFSGTLGQYFGGKQIRGAVSPSWTISQNFSFALDYEYNHIDARQQTFNAHLMRLRLLSAFNRAISINAFLQFNTLDDRLGANIRLRYNPREGNDLYIVYNENLNTQLDAFDPRLPRTQSRGVILKYTYTLIR